MRNLFKSAALLAVLACAAPAFAQSSALANNLAPPQADAVSLRGSTITREIVEDRNHATWWKITVWVNYTALNDRTIICQVQDQISGNWVMLTPVPSADQTTNGSAFVVRPGQGVVKFEWWMPMDCDWGQYISAYNYCDPIKVWVGEYSGDDLKGEATTELYAMPILPVLDYDPWRDW